MSTEAIPTVNSARSRGDYKNPTLILVEHTLDWCLRLLVKRICYVPTDDIEFVAQRKDLSQQRVVRIPWGHGGKIRPWDEYGERGLYGR